MSDPSDSEKSAPAVKSMADLLAAKKAASASAPGGKNGRRASEREAAARSSAMSKPAPRKG